MMTSDARVAANQANAAKSSGPKTVEGKERSRQNSFKHGLTGGGIVLPESDSIEVTRRTAKFAEELGAFDEVGVAFARLAALNSVRIERGADQQTVAMARRIRQVEADFVAPEGADEAEAAKLLDEAIRFAMFDPSKEATLARRYEVAAERGFYKAVKQLRQMELQAEAIVKVDDKARVNEMMGSILAAQKEGRERDADMDAMEARMNRTDAQRPANSARLSATAPGFEVPFTIGRSR